MKNIIVIPTYWTFPGEDTFKNFDHPVSIKEKGTLECLLQSFRKHKIGCETHIIVSPLHPKTEKKVRSITNKFPDLDIHVFTRIDTENVFKVIKNKRLSKEFRSKIDVDSYGGIRNIGLILGLIKKVDNIIFLDDDEVIEKKNFIKIAEGCMGNIIKRKKLVGKTGYYIGKNNRYRPSIKTPSWKKHWQKQKHLNKTYNNIRSKQRLHETSNALGGNMVINKELFSTVPFDPYIARGEDLDYLLNAKHFKFRFLFDNKLVIKHLPPETRIPYWLKFRRDIYRFLYEREKMKYFNFTIEDLDSYPKFLLGENLEFKAITTSVEYAKYCLKNGDKKGHEESLKNAKLVENDAKRYAKKNAPKYFKFQKEWLKFVKIIKKHYE